MSESWADPPDPAKIAELVTRAQAGDENAYGELFQCYKKRIRGYFYLATKNLEDANDLTSETFLRVWRALPRTDERLREENKFKTYVFCTAYNLLKDYRDPQKSWRHNTTSLNALNEASDQISMSQAQEKDPALRVISAEDEALERMYHAERLEHMKKALEQLTPPRYREILYFKLIKGYSNKKIASLLGISPSCVSAYLARGRKELRRTFNKLQNNPEPKRGGEL